MKQNSVTKTARILIVDDHPIVRRGLAELISDERGLEVCGEASNSVDALNLVDSLQPDLVIVDISLEGSNGIDLIKQIKARSEGTKMLVSSMHEESLFAERALRAGALGYINKQEATHKLNLAIRQVIRGKVYLSKQMTERLLQRTVEGSADPDTSSIEKLSDRELEVFGLMGQGLGTREIANRLHLSVKTIETYREHIKTKLNLDNSSELIRRAVEWTLRGS